MINREQARTSASHCSNYRYRVIFYQTLSGKQPISRSRRGIHGSACFRNTKKAGRTKERAREKVGSLVGQRRCCSFPSSGLRHPYASRPTRARTPPTLTRWCTWRYAAYARTCTRVCACARARVCLAGLHACAHTRTRTPQRHGVRAHSTTHQSTHLGS